MKRGILSFAAILVLVLTVAPLAGAVPVVDQYGNPCGRSVRGDSAHVRSCVYQPPAPAPADDTQGGADEPATAAPGDASAAPAPGGGHASAAGPAVFAHGVTLHVLGAGEVPLTGRDVTLLLALGLVLTAAGVAMVALPRLRKPHG